VMASSTSTARARRRCDSRPRSARACSSRCSRSRLASTRRPCSFSRRVPSVVIFAVQAGPRPSTRIRPRLYRARAEYGMRCPYRSRLRSHPTPSAASQTAPRSDDEPNVPPALPALTFRRASRLPLAKSGSHPATRKTRGPSPRDQCQPGRGSAQEWARADARRPYDWSPRVRSEGASVPPSAEAIGNPASPRIRRSNQLVGIPMTLPHPRRSSPF
jgi:hypothetical protein